MTRKLMQQKYLVNPLSANPTKWSNTLKQLVKHGVDHFMGLALIGLNRDFNQINANSILQNFFYRKKN